MGVTMSGESTEQLVERMFRFRRYALNAGLVCLGWIVGLGFAVGASFLTDRGETFGIVVLACVVLVVQLWSVVTWYYVFRVGLREVGWKYAIGHFLLCIPLTYLVLIGIMLVPLLVEADVERLRRWEEVRKGIIEAHPEP